MSLLINIRTGLIVVIILLSHVARSNCFSFQRDTILPSSTRIISLNISGAINNDLADVDQCVAAVSLSFRHPRVIHLTIRLVSPFGDTITLVGGSGLGNATNLGRWDVSFAPCSESAIPDPSFDAQFNTGNNWGNGIYSGVYYPNMGCLENFNRGPVNGEWQLIITNTSPFDNGIFLGMGMFFCDAQGLDCFVCNPGQSSITTANSSLCEGDDRLNLDITRSFIGFEPDPFLYNYTFLTFQGDTLFSRGNNIDLRSASPGVYQVCGLSYYNEDESLIPSIGDTVTSGELIQQLNSNDPLFCGRLSNCLQITISSQPDTLYIRDTICQGEVYTIGTQTWDSSIQDTLIVQSVAGCDSIIVLDLLVLDLEWVFSGSTTLACDTSPIINRISILNNTAIWDTLLFEWRTIGGIVISDLDSAFIDTPGKIFITIEGIYNGSISCFFNDSIELTVEPFIFIPQISPLFTACPGSEIPLFLSDYIPDLDIIWNVPPGIGIVGPNTQDTLRVFATESGSYEVCASLTHPCMNTTQVCTIVDINTSPNLGIPQLQNICGRSVDIEVANLQNIQVNQLTPGSQAEIIILGGSFTINQEDIGNFSFEISGLISGCDVRDTFEVNFIDTLFVDLNVQWIDSCGSNPAVELALINEGSLDFNLSVSTSSGSNLLTIPSFTTQQFILSFDAPSNDVLVLNEWIPSNGSCNFILDDSIQLNFPGEIIFADTFERCNSDRQGGITTFNIGSLFDNLASIELIEAGELNSRLDNFILDFTGVEEGFYEVNVTYNRPGCPSQIVTIGIEISSCLCPEITDEAIGLTVCEGDSFNLNSIFVYSTTGTWALLTGPVTDLGNVSAGLISSNLLVAGSYMFQFIANDETCNELYLYELEVVLPRNTGQAIEEINIICSNNLDPIPLGNLITGQDLGGTWTFTTTQHGFTLDEQTGILTPLFYQNADIEIQYGFFDDICTQAPTVLRLLITVLPDNNLPDTLYLECGASEVQLSLNSQWLQQDGFFRIIGDPESFFIDEESGTLSLSRTGTFEFFWGNSALNCTRQHSIVVINQFEPITDAIFEIIPPTCWLDSIGSVLLLQVLGGEGPYTWYLSDGTNGGVGDVVYLGSGMYTYTIFDNNGCEYTGNFQIDMPPFGSIDLGETINTSIGSEITIIPTIVLYTSRNISQIDWYFNRNFECESCDLFTFVVLENSWVHVELTDDFGCKYVDSVEIRINPGSGMYLPNAFSPNGDGVNDILQIYTRAGYGIIQYWHIYDRWGTRVFSVDTPFDNTIESFYWDGTFKGIDLLPGTYVSYTEVLLQNGVTKRFVQEVQILR